MNGQTRPTGVLLLQLGTPDSTKVSDVRTYLRQFLSDPRVMDVPAPLRWLLLNAVILPFRPRRSAEAYEKIWTEDGSPLIVHTETLAAGMREELGSSYRVAYGMRYRNPTTEAALDQLTAAGCDRMVILPLFPQYASASGGSAAARALQVVGSRHRVPEVSTIGPFYQDAGFVRAVAVVAHSQIRDFRPDHVLFSYHGLPEKQVDAAHGPGERCLSTGVCPDRIEESNRDCYRAQCYATTRAVASELGLEPGTYTTTFQSRLAGQKWIEPYTDQELPRLHESGVRRLAVLTPSFVADCLETLEEIGIRARKQWADLGGEDFLLVPCVNSHPAWVSAAADLVRKAG